MSRYYHNRVFSTAQSKPSEPKKDTLSGVIELYDSKGTSSGHPTRKDLYETSMTVPARSLQPNVYHHSPAETETDASHLINDTHWYN